MGNPTHATPVEVIPPSCRGISLRSFKFWFMMLLWFVGCRIGEAQVPGPSPVESRQSPSAPSTWSFAVCNPSGLSGKGQLLTSLGVDLAVVSETHLSKESASLFQLGLRTSGSHFKHVVTGAPMAHRSTASDVGNWAGVAFVSRGPCRTLSVPWPEDAYETGRIQFSTSFVDHRWITGGVVYGYPESKRHINAVSRTLDLLRFASGVLLDLKGPRYLAGDWNLLPDQLDFTDVLRRAGWQEAQDLREAITGTPPQATCKATTRKDFLWLSPELVRSFHSLQVDVECFADHAVLVARFRTSKVADVQYVWPCPSAIPWTKVPPAPSVPDFLTGDPTQVFSQFWQQREKNARQALQQDWRTSMGGRGQQTAPRKVLRNVAPLKASRSHEVKPGFYGFHMQHLRWFKQLRRLQNYCVWVKNRDVTKPADVAHGLGLWRSVINAPGFVPSFSQWWKGRMYRGPSDPAEIPAWLPAHDVACVIFDAFRCEVRVLEQNLISAQRVRKREQHLQDANLVFRDVRRPPPEPVETLLQHAKCKVVEVQPEFHGLVVDQLPGFDLTRPVMIQGQAHEVVHQDTDTIWIDDTSQVTVGSAVTQTTYLGELPAIFEAFHTRWKARWCRHDHLPHTHWNELVSFARRLFPHVPVPVVPLDGTLLQAEATRKKAKSAVGLDGVSRHDVITLDLPSADALAQVTHRACLDGCWPRQMMAGKVVSLAKTDTAETVNQYRPITVFSFLYRCWSSLNSRALLDSADQWAHDDIYGNRKGRQAASLWRELVSSIEVAYATKTSLSGLTADVEKAFNCLPRWPILCMAIFAGASFEVVQAWTGALCDMVRHFKVQSSYSQGFFSSTGLAEGCGLSCYGMLLLDHVFHHWISAQSRMVRALSYVDNLDLVTTDPQQAVRQLDFLLQFATLTDLTIDRSKTFGWSVDPEVRAQFREAGIPLRYWARDLGAHLGFSRQFTNSTVTDRFRALEDLWPRLKRSSAPAHSKLRVLRTVAWSRGLHAVSSAAIGQQQWLQLRRRANDALGFKRHGLNPMLHLGLVETLDPEFCALDQTVRDARSFMSEVQWDQLAFPYAAHGLELPATSTSRVLVDRLHSVGLTVHAQGLVSDPYGVFSLLTTNYQEVKLRLTWLWEKAVASRVSHRPDFQGLRHADPHRTRKFLATLDVSRKALMKLQLAGAFFTSDVEEYWLDGPGECQWCGQQDSLEHRFWSCPQTAPLRDSCITMDESLQKSLPDACRLRGWAVRPPIWEDWITQLCQPLDLPSPCGKFNLSGWNHVFTDGSCFNQAHAFCRLAAWSVLLVPANNPTWNFDAGCVLAASCLVGLCQTSFRAELFAVAWAVHAAACQGAKVILWTDCQGVYFKLQLLLRGTLRWKPNSSNADLWFWLQQSVQSLGRENVQIRKVAAHRDVSKAVCRQEVWEIWNNRCADIAAKMANLDRSAAFWSTWLQLVQQQQVMDDLHSQVRRLHLAVAELSIRKNGEADQEDPQVRPPKQARVFEPVFRLGNWDGRHLAPDFTQRYGPGLARRIHWWWQQRVGQPDGPVRWISFCHLYVDYQLSFGCPGPYLIDKKIVDPLLRPFLDVAKTPFNVRVRWFRSCLLWFFHYHGISIGLANTRCISTVLHAHLACASLSWDDWCLQTSEEWIAANLTKPCLRGSDALKTLPLVSKHPGMSVVLPSRQ